MKKLAILAAVLLAVMAVSVPAMAGDEVVTLEGKIVCAKCSLHEEGLAKCQNVLVVDDEGKTSHYYLVKNDVDKEFGDVCMAKKPVQVTGTVSEKDGKSWIAATEIAPTESKG